MNQTVEPAAAAVCDYCGRKNPDQLAYCSECGTRLLLEPEPPPPKSKVLAIGLTLVFGPIGLLYVGAWIPAFVLFLATGPFLLAHKGGLWLFILVRILSAAWSYHELVEQDKRRNLRWDPKRLLDAAARLESKDRTRAVAAYQKITQLYPDTPASAEAARSIQTLEKHANESGFGSG